MRGIACLATLAVAASAAAISKRNARANYETKEDFYVPNGWQRVADADLEHIINLSFGLKQSNFDELERHLYEVSDPDHSRYGQHLTSAEVDTLVAPHDDTTSLVHEWLLQYGIDTDRMSYSTTKDWIHIRMPVREVEALLDTKYSVFKHEDGTHLVRTTSYAMPKHLHEHIDVIAPTTSFGRGRPQVVVSKRSTDSMPVMAEDGLAIERFYPGEQTASIITNGSAVMKACNFSAVTPSCLRTIYGTVDYKVQSAGKNKVGIANYLNETQNTTDLAFFLRKYRPDAVPGAKSIKFNIIQGGQNQQTQLNAVQLANGQDLEGNLDGETVLGISYPTPVTSFNTGGMPPFVPDLVTPTDTNEPYLAWVNYVLSLNDDKVPQVITTSYGDDEQTVPESFAKRVCQQYARLGARGVTLLFSSGDSGVGTSGKCFSNKPGAGRLNQFLPAFSASCPYVTTVGGTKGYPEVVAYDTRNGYAPGGGFSNYFPRPSYQDAVVSSYIKSLNGRFDGLYNKTGRAYPDIAAQSQSFITGWNGTFVLLDGTSAASPAAAGVLTLVNDALIAAGKPVLGFFNPALYKSLNKGFTDITSGSAIGCNRKGFPAQSGWDAASGWGSPNFPKILEALGVPQKS